MFNALLYRLTHQLKHQPLKLALMILAVIFCVALVFLPYLDAEEIAEIRNPLIINGLTVSAFVITLLFSVFSGGSGFTCTTSDVQFHLAGPFTQRFNLLIMIGGAMKVGLFLVYLICCYSSLLFSSFGFTTSDILVLILVVFSGLFLGQIYSASENASIADNDEKGQKRFKSILGSSIALFLIITAAVVLPRIGGIDGMIAGGYPVVLSEIGRNPVIYVMIGIAVVFMIIRTLIILRRNPDYYEQAVMFSQKIADEKAAKDAGLVFERISSDSKRKSKTKRLKGWGANAFFYKHINENTRISYLPFVNRVAVIYRLLPFFMGIFMSGSLFGDGSDGLIYSQIVMHILLGGIIFSGGRALMEFNKPYIFLVPENNASKVFNMIFAQVPEILFDSVLGTLLTMYYIPDKTPLMAVSIALMFIISDFFATLFGIMISRIFPTLHGNMLTTLRMIAIYFLMIGLFILSAPLSSIISQVYGLPVDTLLVIVFDGILLIMNIVMLFVDASVLEHAEMA